MTPLLTNLFRRRPRAEHLTFTVYTRAQCCCCHKALDVLKDAQQRFGFTIEAIDVDGDPKLVAQFDTEVPVVALNGKVRFRGVVNPTLLDRLLMAEIQDPPVSDMRAHGRK
jgi:glutaredoxin